MIGWWGRGVSERGALPRQLAIEPTARQLVGQGGVHQQQPPNRHARPPVAEELVQALPSSEVHPHQVQHELGAQLLVEGPGVVLVQLEVGVEAEAPRSLLHEVGRRVRVGQVVDAVQLPRAVLCVGSQPVDHAPVHLPTLGLTQPLEFAQVGQPEPSGRSGRGVLVSCGRGDCVS